MRPPPPSDHAAPLGAIEAAERAVLDAALDAGGRLSPFARDLRARLLHAETSTALLPALLVAALEERLDERAAALDAALARLSGQMGDAPPQPLRAFTAQRAHMLLAEAQADCRQMVDNVLCLATRDVFASGWNPDSYLP